MPLNIKEGGTSGPHSYYKKIVQRLIFFVCATLVAHHATAFDTPEHERMGNLGFKIALAYFKATHLKLTGAENTVFQEKIIDAMKLAGRPGKFYETPTTNNASISYGDIVACVDFFLYPEKILTDAWKFNRAPSSPDGFPHAKENVVIRDFFLVCHNERATSFAQASHNNHAHFQRDALMSQRLYHMAAIAVANGEGKAEDSNLFGALVMNAIADHYLQDFFAPGHIVTPREAMSDVPATAMHDRANEDGLDFVPANMVQLLPILKFICKWEETSNHDQCEDDKDPDLKQLLGRSTQEDLNVATQSLLHTPTRPIRFRGDQRLWDVNNDQLKQRIYILLVQVRSILDILEGKQSFREMQWKSRDVEEGWIKGIGLKLYLPYHPTVAEMAFGHYCLPDKNGKQQPDDCAVDQADASVARSEKNTGMATTSQISTPPPPPALYQIGDFYPMLGFSAHRESMSAGARTGRNVYTLETAVWGTPSFLTNSDKIKMPTISIAPILGYTRYNEGSVSGSGPTLRLLVNWAETEFSVSPYIRWLSYDTDAGRKRKFSGGMRAEVGFSSYSTFFLAVGRDHGQAINGALEKGWIWSAGFEVALPWSRVPKVNGRAPSGEKDLNKELSLSK